MIARNALLNLAGHAAPLLAALFVVPLLVLRLGTDRFGFLALAWVLIAYFSLFDLGFGRALSRLVAERMGGPQQGGLRELSKTALTIAFSLGIVAGGILFIAAETVCIRLLRLPPALQLEAVEALKTLALCVPLATLTGTLRGLLEARYRFGWLTAIRVPLGILTFVAPLAASLWSTSLVALAAALAVVRLAAFGAHWIACAKLDSSLTALGWPTRWAVREMFSYGAWLTVSNVVGPLLVYVDRFAIGILVAVSAVAYYAAPYEVVTRLWIIPAALSGVLFPVMAAALPAQLPRLYRIGIKAVLIVVFPLAITAVLFARDWLGLWLGDEYATHGARVAQLLCLGVVINCLGYLPATLLQARGRADLMAKLHLSELPVYLLALWILVPAWELEGAAFAWAARCIVDAGLLFVLARRYVLNFPPRFTLPQLGAMAFSLAALIGAFGQFSLFAKTIYFTAVLAAFAALVWLVLLDPSERSRARHPLSLILGER
jgi:O-antigen/teichoic acid export membrane protein